MYIYTLTYIHTYYNTNISIIKLLMIISQCLHVPLVSRTIGDCDNSRMDVSGSWHVSGTPSSVFRSIDILYCTVVV